MGLINYVYLEFEPPLKTVYFQNKQPDNLLTKQNGKSMMSGLFSLALLKFCFSLINLLQMQRPKQLKTNDWCHPRFRSGLKKFCQLSLDQSDFHASELDS